MKRKPDKPVVVRYRVACPMKRCKWHAEGTGCELTDKVAKHVMDSHPGKGSIPMVVTKMEAN